MRREQAGGIRNPTRTHTVTQKLAGEMEDKGDGVLMSFLMENDVGIALERALKAMDAKERSKRASMTRLEILKEYLDTHTCTCCHTGANYKMMKEVLVKNGMDGSFQKAVIMTLRTGREKLTNLCIIGASNMAKSYVLKPLFLIFRTYTRPDGGSYQLEDLLDKEMVFLNDFEFNDDAKKWMPWPFLKNFLEGEHINVARPKNRGGNAEFKSDAPVFMTAPQEVELYRGKCRDEYETTQMRNRVSYLRFTQVFIKEEGVPDVKPCGHCGARLYLEGADPWPARVRTSVAPASASSASATSSACIGLAGTATLPASPAASTASASGVGAPPPKKTRMAVDIIKAIGDAKALKDSGCIGSPDFAKLRDQLLRGE